ncbi:MAG TPA: hypothetical protein VEU30_09350 [Thermoanaerobaculia bacterium]|nr:hypothetical protein [Thermoanaerobaculia bacterium]
MSDEEEKEEKKKVAESLRDWGFDAEKFQERAKESLESARGDLSEITGTLRQTLVHAKDIVAGLQKNGAPVAAELKTGFERAWHEIEAAFKAARSKAKDPKGEGGAADADADSTSDSEPPSPS